MAIRNLSFSIWLAWQLPSMRSAPGRPDVDDRVFRAMLRSLHLAKDIYLCTMSQRIISPFNLLTEDGQAPCTIACAPMLQLWLRCRGHQRSTLLDGIHSVQHVLYAPDSFLARLASVCPTRVDLEPIEL